ncbi:MAG: NADH-quinone oxidoreductase subunit NuoF [Firmicutes bacterium]|nr:NADH-quinone oxidoreductase subunit NuoF [Bacillota bacterium]MDD4694327.1 NADH-quinone oxidoreductase subunit NuoF [Bacillota bacterium]
MEKIRSASELVSLREQIKKELSKNKLRILVCAGTGCVAGGSLEIFDEFKRLLLEKNLDVDCELDKEDNCNNNNSYKVAKSGCHGFCAQGPLIRIEPEDILYTHVKIDDVEEIVNETILKGNIIDRLIYKNPSTGEKFSKEHEIPFYKKQQRRALANCGIIDPESLEEYIANDGYSGLSNAVGKTPQEVIDDILNSGLRGRGGGGFPTGRKLQFGRNSKGDKKYVICNGDEGDPGAFMDRSVMEGDPHKVIEGMAISAYAIGANEGYIYVRAEYPMAIARLRTAIKEALELGIIGDSVLGTDFSFHVHIKEGAGAFVCGEETALIASIEGKRGMPNPKPPFPTDSGLWGCPTVINNVETLANISLILDKGPDYFKNVGEPNSPGTKTFALTGQVANTGLIEVPMGTTLREIVYDIGGGIIGNKKYKAVQIGGPSGGCLTEDHLDIKLDFDSLKTVGAMIGSGGLVVMDEKTCIVEVARFFMSFTQVESCGKCVLCREGTKRMLEILERIVAGKGTVEDLDLLVELGETIKDGSLCGLGKTAPNPVLTTLKYFHDEYLHHVENKVCDAKVCSALKVYAIDPEICKGCTRCKRVCPAGAISGKVKEAHTIDVLKCIKCGACVGVCAFNAIKEA